MKIALVKEPTLYREGILKVLQDHFRYDEIYVNDETDYQILMSENHIADLIIIALDANTPLMDLIKFYQAQNKKIITWISYLNDETIIQLFKLDLDGYFFNGMEKEEMLQAIASILKGRKYFAPDLSPILFNDYVRINRDHTIRPDGVFSKREWEILELLTKGCTNEQIGQSLFISDKTVKNHVSSILRKLEVKDRTNAVLTALKNRWFLI